MSKNDTPVTCTVARRRRRGTCTSAPWCPRPCEDVACEESRRRGPHIHRHLTRRFASAAPRVHGEPLEAGRGDVDGEEGTPNQHEPEELGLHGAGDG
jgi:hypothetical protein